MTKPARYALMWDAGDSDTTKLEFEDFDGDEGGARERARAISSKLDLTILIFERTELEDVTPAGDPAGLLWDYAETFIDDVTAPDKGE